MLASFGSPYDASEVVWKDNQQVDNPKYKCPPLPRGEGCTGHLETLTLDGWLEGGAYTGPLAAADGTRLTLGRPALMPSISNANGALIAILNGTGVGQWRRVVSGLNNSAAWEIESPFDVVEPGSSIVSVMPVKARLLLVGNTFVDAAAVQLYGACYDCIVASNQFTRSGVASRGNYDQEPQPNVRVQFLDNVIERDLDIWTNGQGSPGNLTATGSGPFAFGVIAQRNSIGQLRVEGGYQNTDFCSATDLVLEDNVLSTATFIEDTAQRVWSRGNAGPTAAKSDDGARPGSRRLVIFQGRLQALGATPEAVAASLGEADTFVLSHAETLNYGNGCLDAGYPGGMGKLIKAIRQRNPLSRVYGYVAGTSDAPGGTKCGQSPAAANWSCPAGGCPNFVDWVSRWKRLGRDAPDGLFVDTVGPGWMSTSVRDSVMRSVTEQGFALMVNAPIELENVRWALEPQAMNGQALLVEGWCYAEQADRTAACHDIAEFLVSIRSRNITRHALVTEAWGAVIQNCTNTRAQAAARPFWASATPHDCWQYSGADLGIATGIRGVDVCVPPAAKSLTTLKIDEQSDDSDIVVDRVSARTVVSCPDKSDCTAAIQSALSNGALDDIVIPSSTGSPWAVGPLFIHRSHLRLTLEPGAVLFAKQGDFKKTGDCLLQIKSDMGHGHVSNVTIVATGATLRMRKMEYLPPAYEKAEWRHTLSINGASDVTVIGGTFLEAGGDGIYVDGGGLSNYSRNILLSRVTADGAWRNGLSVISAINLTVADSTFQNTAGTNPQW